MNAQNIIKNFLSIEIAVTTTANEVALPDISTLKGKRIRAIYPTLNESGTVVAPSGIDIAEKLQETAYLSLQNSDSREYISQFSFKDLANITARGDFNFFDITDIVFLMSKVKFKGSVIGGGSRVIVLNFIYEDIPKQ